MKYTILDAHIKFFQEKGFIAFEDLLSFQDLEKLQKEIQNVLLKPSSLNTKRDLFRKSELIKKIALNKHIASILKNLTNKKNLRLIFDRVIFTNQTPFDKKVCLNDIISFQGLICSLIIKIEQNSLGSNHLSSKNNLLFIKSNFPINLEEVFLDSKTFLLLAYGELKTVYRYNPKDPNTSYLKQFGYTFGDVLKDELHPVIF